MRIRLLYACSVMAFICAMATTQGAAAEPTADGATCSATETSVHRGTVATGEVFPLPENIRIQKHYYNPSTGESGVAATRSEDEPILVYSNIGGSFIYVPGPNRPIADDVTTVAVGGCHVNGYEILVGVYGSEGGGDSYTVNFGLWTACPGASPPGQLVPGTEGMVPLDDDGLLHSIEVDLEGSEVPMESGFWVGVRFTGNTMAGWVAGSRADTGFTQDIFDFPHPSLRCKARVGGAGNYSGFYVQVWCSPDPPFAREFRAYYNPDLDAPVFYPGPAQWTADDATLIVDDCELSSLEVGVIGTSGAFNMQVELWSQYCDPDRVIEGTHRTYSGLGDGNPELARFTFLDEDLHGIPIAETVWVAWKFNKAGIGPIISGYPVLSHGNEDRFGMWDLCADLDGPQCNGDGDPCVTDEDCPEGACSGDGAPCHTDADCPEGESCIGAETCDFVIECCDEACYFWFGGDPYAGFNATIRCLGEAPRGACCDMSSAAAAEGFCRESTEEGCSSARARWAKGRTCDEFDAFDPPCGYSACCLPPVNPYLGSEGCVDLPQYDPPIPCTVDEDCPRLDCPDGGGFCETGMGLPIPCMDDFGCPPGILCDQETFYCERGFGCSEIFERIACQSNEDCPNADCDTNRGYCIQEVEEHPAIWSPAAFCNIEPQKHCNLWACLFAEGPCDVAQPWPDTGCNDAVCCDLVCRSGNDGAYCCQENWDQWCATLAQSICEYEPMNDECVGACDGGDNDGDPCYEDGDCLNGRCEGGAIPVVFNEQCWNHPDFLCAEASNVRATINPDDPGFCCHPAGAGTLGKGSLWYKFEAPAEKVKIDMCKSPTDDDSLVEVYEVTDWGDPCNNLRPIACNDDGGCAGLGESELNARMNVFNLTVGNTYYLQFASKTAESKGKYKVLISPAYAAPPPGCSYCFPGVGMGLESIPFDLEDTLMDCPSEPLLPAMQNDVWFNFLAFAGGLYSVTTCPESGPGPDTTLAVYRTEGINEQDWCPVDPEWRLGVNDDWGGDCGFGSRVFFSHPSGMKVFKIRVGGENGSEPSGMLTITLDPDCNGNRIPDACDISCEPLGGACDMPDCGQSADCNSNDVPDDCDIVGATSEDCQPNGVPDECDIAEGTSEDVNDNDIPDECECPDASVIFDSPPDGFLDARQPHPVDDATTLQGQSTFRVVAPPACCSTECWSASETNDNPDLHPDIWPPNVITVATLNEDDTCTLELERAIAHGEVTTITYDNTALGGITVTPGTFTFHPGDVNDSSTSTAEDITALFNSLNGGPPLSDERADIDRDGEQGPADILRLLDLLNGAGDYEAWLGV